MNFNEIVANVFGWVISMTMSVGGAGADNLKVYTDGIMGEVIKKMWDYFAVIGIGLTLVYFLLELNQKYALEGRDITLKTFGIPFLKLLFAVAILAKSGDMIGWVFTWGNNAYGEAAKFVETDAYVNSLTNSFNGMDSTVSNSVTSLLGTNSNDETTTNQATAQAAAANAIGTVLQDKFKEMKLGVSVFLLLVSVIMFILNVAVSIVWTYKAIAYKLEVLYRVGITPIAMADIYSGHNSGAIRWIKGCVGLVLYGMSFVILPKLANVLTVSQLTETITSIMTDTTFDLNNIIMFVVRFGACIAAPFAALGCLSAIRQLIKEATG